MKEISRDDYLKALGLFHLAREHYKKTSEFVRALEILMRVPDDDLSISHFADEVYSLDDASLDAAMKRADYIVAPEAR